MFPAWLIPVVVSKLGVSALNPLRVVGTSVGSVNYYMHGTLTKYCGYDPSYFTRLLPTTPTSCLGLFTFEVFWSSLPVFLLVKPWAVKLKLQSKTA